MVSKIYIATDRYSTLTSVCVCDAMCAYSSPVDMQSYELCCDMIDVVIDVSCIYGWASLPPTLTSSHPHSPSRPPTLTPSHPHSPSRPPTLTPSHPHVIPPSHRLSDDGEGSAFDQQSSSIIRLNNGTILYLREVNRWVCVRVSRVQAIAPLTDRFLSLVCLLREDVFERQGLIEYNFHCFREAIQDVSVHPITSYNQEYTPAFWHIWHHKTT